MHLAHYGESLNRQRVTVYDDEPGGSRTSSPTTRLWLAETNPVFAN